MRFANANSFKSKIKDIAKKKGVPAQQVQQQYLLEEILKAIALSQYKDSKYQENLWLNYQKRFLYAKEISYAQTNDCLYELLSRTDI